MVTRISFLRQITPLLISLAVIGGLSFTVRKFEREAPRPFDRLIVEVLPELPDLTGRPSELIERLENAHAKLEVGELQREALVELAYLYHANGFFSQAESCYLGLESFETENARWPYLLGVLKEDRMNQAEVATHFARSITLDPARPLSYFRLGEAYRKGGEFKDARTAYEYCVLGAPNDGWARLGLGRISVAEREWELAKDWLEKAIDLMPKLEPVRELLPDVYLELGNIDKAKSLREDLGKRALVSEPRDAWLSFLSEHCYDSYRLLEYARESRAAGFFEEALSSLERALLYGAEDMVVVEEVSNLIEELQR
ncbi:hypothetical protein [Pelagicoccus sp. SDUM812002]|uniref:tetratricopeptide repeat protein n=1 Tax=Pelagicoccus sp. SDUM812002 TaxID=3041266 RepID=UPI0028108D5C|nr:hypothetical protein [Pelagicoccus sp. SDUM812002]MDQ8187851.1 hypothetical protein [Pelagicoccus sp. SDUM812002]